MLILLLSACNNGQSMQMEPQKVYRIVYEIRPNDWYQKQSELWKQEIDKNPGNTDAWYNYYNANRYAHFENIDSKQKKEKLDKIIEDMGKAIPNTYEYYLLKFWNTYDIHDMELVDKAYKLRPDKPDTYYPYISNAKETGNKKLEKEFCEKLYQSKDIASWLINYNYNVLMSVDNNAILITNGDNDTYPVWMLQSAKNVRNDVTVINVSMSTIESYLKSCLSEKNIVIDYNALQEKTKNQKEKGYGEYREAYIKELITMINKKYPDVPIYFALTVYENIFKSFKENLYVTGLAYRYSEQRLDNLAIVKKNLENRFRLNYLNNDWYGEEHDGKGIKNMLHTNYVVPMVMLAEHYKNSGQDLQADKWKNMALQIAQDSNNEKLVEYIKEKDI